MKTKVTLQLLEEARAFELRFTCDECAYFQGDRCAHGWPEGERSRTLHEGDVIVFCKEFEGGP